MNTRAFTLSLIIAAIAMFMVYTYIEGRENVFKSKYGQKVGVVVAKRDIKEFELIDDSKVTMEEVPKNFVTPGSFKTIKEVFNTIATVPILQGEQISKPRVTYPGSSTGLSRQIGVGKRAISITVSEDQAVSRLIKPGDRVDVLALIDYAGGRKEFFKVKTVLQDVLILSTGLSISNSIPLVGMKTAQEVRTMKLNTYTNYSTVTMELDPFQIQKIVFLERMGARLSLTLRNNDDKEMVRIKGTKLFDLLGEDAPEAKAYFSDKKAKEDKR